MLSYIVAQRTREIGVRMALGAEAGRVRRMVVAQGARVVVLGVVVGVVVAAGSTRALGSLLFGVEALDLVTFVAVAAVMVVVGLLAATAGAARVAGGSDRVAAGRRLNQRAPAASIFACCQCPSHAEY